MAEGEDKVNGDTVRRGVGMVARLAEVNWPSFMDRTVTSDGLSCLLLA